jgi:DNA mismatch repair protein MutS2
MGQRGELVTLPDAQGNAEVQLGALKMRVPARDIERLSKRQARATGEPPALTLPPRTATEAPALQLDIRGWRVDDALPAIDTYLNDAFVAGMPFVRILHGKGTGALRQAIRQQLARHPLVRTYQAADAREGGDGVTVVTLAS